MTTPPVKPSAESRAVVQTVHKVLDRLEQNQRNAILLRNIRGVPNLNAARPIFAK